MYTPGLTVFTVILYMFRIILFCLSLLVLGCSTVPYTVIKKSEIDAQIVAARSATQLELKSLGDKQLEALNQAIAAHLSREQAAADYLFKGLAVAGTLKSSPTRPEMVMGQSIQETAAQLPAATPTAQIAALKALQTELDETKTSAETLKTQYEGQLTTARSQGEVIQQTLIAKEATLKEIEAKRVVALTDASVKEQALQAAKDKIQESDAAKLKKEAEDTKHNEKVKMWLMGVLLAAAAACGLGAAFVPIPSLKGKLIIGAAICGGAALAIPFIEPWMVMVAIVVLLIPVVAWTVKAYQTEHGDATDLMRGLNEIKTKGAAEWETLIAPVLKEWQDPAAKERIKTRLKQVGDT